MSRKKISSSARITGPSPEQIRKRNLIIGILIVVAVALVATITVSINREENPAASNNSPKLTSTKTAGGATGQTAAAIKPASAQSTAAGQQPAAPANAKNAQNAALRNIQGMTVQDINEGTGKTAENGDQVTVNYVGTLTNGTVFDSSIARNQPFTFTIGAGQVIKGWDLGVAGMKVGGERKLVIPPSLGYGSTGTPGGPIPPNSTLDFTVDLLKIK
jgi:peptidylprolyl isomerase